MVCGNLNDMISGRSLFLCTFLIVALVAIAVLLARRSLWKLKRPPDGRNSGPCVVLRRVGASVLVVILFLVFAESTYLRNNLKNQQRVKSYEVWGVFHYYLGAKYFSELGYSNLYPCALEADHESAGHWDRIVGARDVETYRMVPRPDLPPCPRAEFTAERWSEFSQDVEQFAGLARPEYFAELFTDKGFNPPPSWVAVAKPLAQAIPISNGRVAAVVFNLDVIAFLIALLMVWWGCGGVTSLLTAGLAIFYFGSFGRIGGNFLQYLWFPLLAGAVICWAKKRPGAAGALVGAAAGLQVFPLFFAMPIVLRGGFDFFKGRKAAELRPYLRFSATFLAVILASFLAGSLAGRGVDGWSEWEHKISLHRNYLQGEIFNIGLANLTAAAISTDRQDGSSYLTDAPNTFTRLQSLNDHFWVYRVGRWILLTLFVLAVWRGAARELMGYGLLILYALASCSPYYYLSLALVPAMFCKSGRSLRQHATWGSVALFAVHMVYFWGVYISWEYLPHLLSNGLIALFLIGLASIPILHPESPSPS